MADYEYQTTEDPPREGRAARLQGIVNLAGTVVSVSLLIGLGVWGYQLTMRDVTAVPVIRALEGPMRIAPEEPGGLTTSYQGLAVNAVAAEGTAAPPPDRLVLAPRPVTLEEEDRPAAALQAEAVQEKVAAAVDNTAVDNAVAQAVAALPADIFAPEEPAEEPPQPASNARLSADLRPLPRPPRRTTVAPVVQPVAQPVEASSLKTGDQLVQLGAFDDAATAEREWARLQSKFGALLRARSRVIQPAESGGRTFYRLRAAGFADDADARRFCTALLAEQAACIPVTVR
ncbi:SPOR domain-containing protein [Haematobacter massiliensis]|uniref:Sporulation protein n=1 Tax=Haematobacter massiliensis TaxID=195105 RepID=A0A086Y7V3_9RHOB|nr:SPOR domain-containing protein [Haematobacter massiliensis]KFI30353.1 sporulation protein [Haematobacter massiliensis]OWJ70500.1 SPOR domain-containing protein [Haematobacter massiliensis]OWJ87360.1 SPOR domain-containing protein [Haematobacter massiliensis]QBJ24812.1 SPOR domain-containing protein [Haematobacter massiliensis]